MGGCVRQNAEKLKRCQGSMTVFFCLILVMIGAIICTCLESARTAGLRFMAETASDSALQSVFADYHEQLWKDYHVFFHHESGDLAESVETYLEYYEEPSKGLYGLEDCMDLWGLSVKQVTVTEEKTALSDGGRLFLEQAVEYERYQIAGDILELLLDRVGILDEIGKIRSFAIRLSQCFEQIQKISTLYQDVRDMVTEAIQLGQQIQKMFEAGEVDLKVVYPRLQSLVEQLSDLVGVAKSYLQNAEKIGNLAQDLTDEYGDNAQSVYGQQINQLLSFTVKGLIGKAVDAVEEKSDGLLGSLTEVVNELELFQEDEKSSDKTAGELKSWIGETVIELVGEMIALDEILNLAENGEENDSGAEDENDKTGNEKESGENLLETVKQWKNMAVLSLAMGADALQTEVDYFAESEHLPSAEPDGELSDVSAEEKGLLIFYIANHFTNGLSDNQKSFAYQQEYILFGKEDSRSNLTAMAESLLAIREGLNLAYVMTDAEMRGLAETVAYSLVGATGLYPLVLITEFIILAAWAFAESVSDLQALFDGERVPLWKTKGTWKTSVSGMVESKSTGFEDEVTEAILGFSYDDYLKLFLLLVNTQTLCLRSMDIIQQELGNTSAGFRMADCYGSAAVTTSFSAPYRLITLPLIEDVAGDRLEVGHQIQAVSSYGYH